MKPIPAPLFIPFLNTETKHPAVICTFVLCIIMYAPHSQAEQEKSWWHISQYFNAATETTPPLHRIDQAHRVQDIAYGELLFDYYQQHYMTSITKILVERNRNGFEHHKSHADLLLGTLYLSYGLVSQAETIFKVLIEESVGQETQNIAWLKLAEIYIEQGKLNKAKNILIENLKLPNEDLNNQRQEHLGNIAAQQKNFTAAITHFKAIKNDPIRTRYARYNTAIAHLRLDQPQLALQHLQELIAYPVNTKEEDGLRDKAAIALGHYYLHHEEPYLASAAFKKVRLGGPFADQALLGLGWSNLARAQTKKALSPWVVLSKRDPSAATTQQALLMVPRTFENLQAWRNAFDSYQLARNTFQNELQHIENTLNYIQKNDWLLQLKPETQSIKQHKKPLDYQSTAIPLQGPEANLLFRLFASAEFDQGFQQYWFLESLSQHLSEWQTQIPTYRNMLTNHQLRHNQMMPAVNRQLNQVALERKKDLLARYEQRFHQTVSDNDLLALANEKERGFLQKVYAGEETLTKLPENKKYTPMKEKHRLIKGVLLWDINEHASDREWQLLKKLKQTTVALYQLEQKQSQLLQAEDYATERFKGYEQRINELESRNTTIIRKIRTVQHKQQQHLQTMAEELLKQRLTHVGNLLANAQLAIARLQDKASVEGNSAQ